jgi:hypothetical protein
MDEGWMRWVLDSWGVPYVSVKNEMLRAGQLDDFLDVLIVADISGRQLDEGRAPGTIPDEYSRGLAPEGAVAIEEFVRGGGTLITFDGASDWAVQLFELPLVNVTQERENREFSCPGSVLRGVPVTDFEGIGDPSLLPFTADLPVSVPLFFSGSGAYRDLTERERREAGLDPRGDPSTRPGERRDAQWGGKPQVLLRYAPERVMLSGWIRNPGVIENRAAWLRADVGEGAVHLFAFRPQYRGWSQSTFPLVFRAMLFE